MPHQSPNLWHMESRVLEGFYQSEVLVAAVNKEDAMQVCMQAYDNWLAERLKDYGYHPLISDNYPDDDEFEVQSKAKRIEFHKELRERLKQIPGRGLLLVSS
jgi:hypothetical protein